MLKYIISISKNSTEVNEMHTYNCKKIKTFSTVKKLGSFNNSIDAKKYAEDLGFKDIYQCPHCCL